MGKQINARAYSHTCTCTHAHAHTHTHTAPQRLRGGKQLAAEEQKNAHKVLGGGVMARAVAPIKAEVTSG